MQKIVIDTNVLVSALIQRSFPYHIVNEALINQEIIICLSEELFHEYYEVLNRKKFAKFPDFTTNAHSILTEIYRISQKYKPTQKLDVISDKDDNMLLELAQESKADFLITGNHTDFTMSNFEGTEIVSPINIGLIIFLKKSNLFFYPFNISKKSSLKISRAPRLSRWLLCTWQSNRR